MHDSLIKEYQPQTLDGHPLVKWSRQDIITYLRRKGGLKVEPWSWEYAITCSWKFKFHLLMNTPEYGNVRKEVSMELYMQRGAIDWEADKNPYDYFTERYNHLAWRRIDLVLRILQDVANLTVPVKNVGWRMFYCPEMDEINKLR